MLELVLRLVAGGTVLLGAVLALKWAQSRGMTARGGPALRVVGRTGLTKSALVAVVAVDERRFLVGAGDGGVRLLTELDPEAPAGADAGEDAELLHLAVPSWHDGGPHAGMADAHAVPAAALVHLPTDARGAAPSDGAATPPPDLPPPDLPPHDLPPHDLHAPGTHGRGAPHAGPRIGPLDRLRAMTVRTHPGEPIRADHPRG